MRIKRRVGLAAGVLGLGLGMALSPLAANANASASPHGRVVPAYKIDGLTPPELLVQFWKVMYTTPFDDVPDCFGLGQTGKVVVTWTENECPVHRGQVLFVAWGNACDDTILDPPFFAVGAKAQRRCVLRSNHQNTSSLPISLDGALPVAALDPRFEFVTHQFTVTPTPDNAAAGTPGVETHALAAGWMAFIEGLAPGAHTFTAGATFPDGGEFTYTRHVDVLR